MCPAIDAFHHAWRYGTETWHEGRGKLKAPEPQEHIFEVIPPKVKGNPDVKLL